MKRNFIAIVCTAVVAAAVLVPLGVGGLPAPDAAVLPQAAQSADGAAGSENAEAGVEAEASADADPSADQAAGDAGDAGEGSAYESGVILVGLQDGATAADLNARLAQLDYVATKQVADDDITFGYAELALADGVSVKGAEARIARDAADVVAAAQPNYLYHIADEATAPTAAAAQGDGAQSTLISGIIAQATSINDTYKDQQWALDAVKAYDAWDTQKADGAVTVAIIDTGIDTDHEDLDSTRIVGARNVVTTVDWRGREKLDETAVEDGNGHGTHVAGIVAATAGNNTGVAGVSYNANIMPIRALDDEGDGSTTEIVSAVEYMTKNASKYNVRVANLSLGGDPDEGDDLMMAAIESAHNRADILFVYAAGNDSYSVSEGGKGTAYVNSPSDLDTNPGAIGVISLEQNGTSYKRSDFSNYNMTGQATKDLSAPGSDILSTAIEGMNDDVPPWEADEIDYLDSEEHYGYLSGTSMASPCVAGVAALAFAAKPDLTAAQVRNVLCNTAQDIGTTGWDTATGHGLVDAAAAVVAAKNGASTTASLTGATVQVGQCTFTGSALKPQVTVTLDGAILSEGDDYTLAYSNNVNAGTGTVTITGTGAFTGATTKKFTIAAKSITPTVTLDATNYVWNGQSRTPRAIVKDGSTVLPASAYTLTYASGRTNVGPYTVKATLKGNYAGTGQAAFTIVPKGTTVAKVKAAKKAFTVKWRKQGVQTSGYQVQYSPKKSFASKVKTVTVSKVKTTSKKVKKLKAKKRYYVRVRTFASVGGVKYYSAWSGAKSVKTK